MKHLRYVISILTCILTTVTLCTPYRLTTALRTHNVKETAIWEHHKTWINQLADFIKEQKDAPCVSHPEDREHPIYFFTHKDARTVVKPLLAHLAGIELDEETIQKLFLQQLPPQRKEHRTTDSVLLLTQDAKKEVLATARRVYEQVKGNILFCIGQTPAYIADAVQEIAQLRQDSETRVIFVPFSGRPDYGRELRSKPRWTNTAFFDLVTHDREEGFRTMLRMKGLDPASPHRDNKTFYFFDNSSGPSLACCINFFQRWFAQENVPFNRTIILHMCARESVKIRSTDGEWHQVDTLDLRLSPTEAIDVLVIFMGMEEKIASAFDKVHDNLRIVPTYNSIYWNWDYEQLAHGYPTKEAQMIIQEYHAFIREQLQTEVA